MSKKNYQIKIKKNLLRLLEQENFQFILGFIFVMIYILVNRDGISIFNSDAIQVTIAFIVLYIIKIASEKLSNRLVNQLEDHLKLETDYNSLIKRYPLEENFIEYDNSSIANKEKFKKKSKTECCNGEYNYRFPVIITSENTDKNIIIEDDKNKAYNKTDVIMENYNHLMGAHSTSKVYNQMNIRLDDIKEENNSIKLFTSRTMYFDSLVSNRAIDFELDNGFSLRELLNPGPFVDDLKESTLSNHLGFNIFIKTSDDYMIFVRRNMDVSVGKGSLGSSVAASLKTRYCLSNQYTFTIEGLTKAVREEIKDELVIGYEAYDFSINDNLILIYRDLVEGGKPQLLFSIDLKIDHVTVKENFIKSLEKENPKYETIKDGDQLLFIPMDQLQEIYISPDSIFYEGDQYDILPSVSGTLAYFIGMVGDNNEYN